jgi:acetoin:2,6-dichlorophenolindophenol oxidoreductase subunit alpha
MQAISNELAVDMYRRMALIRRFEDRLYQLFLQGLVPGTLHQYQGQEAIAAGVCSALRRDDFIFSTHRPVGHAIAKGVKLKAIAAELWGVSTGCAGGKGGQMHLVDPQVGMPPSNAIVGANIPIAVGAALASKLQGLDRVAVCFFGDGATNTGAFHEGLNLAAVKNAPVVFICENNQYAASTHVSLTMRVEDISLRAAAYGIQGFTLDGMDARVVYSSAKEAVERARNGSGPTFLEYKTYRFMGHSRGDPGGYRSKDDLKTWQAQDPLPRFREVMTGEYGLPESELESLEATIDAEVEHAIEFAQASELPESDQIYAHVYAPGGGAP